MEKELPGWSLGELASIFGGTLDGPADLRILRPVPADGTDPAGLTFAEKEEYLLKATEGGAAAVLAPRGSASTGKPTIFVDRPRECFGRFLAMCHRPLPIAGGIHPQASVSPEASIDPTANVGAFAVVERGAVIGPKCRVYAFAYIGEDCVLGEGTVIYPHAVLYQDVRVGARCAIHAGTVIGADGFGYVWDGKRRVKVPQVGGVVLGDDVEIGSNTTIDRATAGVTEIGNGTKIDNLCQIAHNCRIGEHTVMASFCGISGSTTIGDRNVLAGQVATSDHVHITDDVVLGGRSGVTNDITKSGQYLGFPARPIGEAMRAQVLTTKLADLFQRVRRLERRIGGESKEDA